MASETSGVVEAEATSTTEADATGKAAVAAPAGEAKVAAKSEAKVASSSDPKDAAKPEAAKPSDAVVPVEAETQATLEFKTPEGEAIKGPVIDAFTEMAKGQKWTQEVASEHLGKLSQSMRDARTAMAAGWEKELRADKDFGGSKFDENLGLVKGAIERIGGADYLKFLAESGLEREPKTMKAWLKVASAISADKFTAGVNVPGRPGQIANPNDTSVDAFAKAFHGNHKQ
jgi:hypothetical protein